MPRVESQQSPPDRPVEIVLDGCIRAYVWPGYARVEVPSDTEPEKDHDVFVRTGMTLCTCPGFRKKNRCKHAARVSGLLSVPEDSDAYRMAMSGDFLGLLLNAEGMT